MPRVPDDETNDGILPPVTLDLDDLADMVDAFGLEDTEAEAPPAFALGSGTLGLPDDQKTTSDHTDTVVLADVPEVEGAGTDDRRDTTGTALRKEK